MAAFDHIFIVPRDFDRSLAFYKDTLGWKVEQSWGDSKGERGAVLTSSGGMSVIIAEEHEGNEDPAWERGINGHRPTVHVKVHDVDKVFATLPEGSHVVVEPQKTHWGVKWFVVRDPDDNLIAFNAPVS